jgi:DNA-binding MarR family transcriptional regulator
MLICRSEGVVAMEKLSSGNIQMFLEFIYLYHNTFFNRVTYTDYYNQGLNKAHLKSLMYLYIHNGGTMTEVSRCVALEKGSFTPVADKLVKLGYIEKTRVGGDKRKSFLKLTPQGTAYAKLIKQVHIEYFEEQLSNLSDRERSDFIKSLTTVYDLLIKMNKL